MLLIGPIVRKPKESESIEQATNCLRDALAFSARVEHPITIHTISDILMRLESLECMDELMDKFDKAQARTKDSH